MFYEKNEINLPKIFVGQWSHCQHYGLPVWIRGNVIFFTTEKIVKYLRWFRFEFKILKDAETEISNVFLAPL